MGQINVQVLQFKLAALRVHELKDILQQLGLPRTGRKDELQARILGLFQDGAQLNARGYAPRDQSRLDTAAHIVDSVLSKCNTPAAVAARRTADVAARAAAPAAAGAAPSAAATGPSLAAAAAAAANKRPRLDGAAAGAAAAGRAAGASGSSTDPAGGVDELISAFLKSGDAGHGAANTQVRCICSHHVPKEPMLQCEGAFCGVWQHVACVGQRLAGQPQRQGCVERQSFYCERCRVARADPFWEIFDPLVMPPVVPQLLQPPREVAVPQSLTNARHLMASTGLRSFNLTRNQLALLQSKMGEYKLQAMCLQLDDAVQFRFHWPILANLHFDGQPVRATLRGPGIKLGLNQRDEPFNVDAVLPANALAVATASSSGLLRVTVQLDLADHTHSWVLLLYMMRRRTKEQVKALMNQPESVAAAVRRVRQHMHGHTTHPSSRQQQQQQGGTSRANGAAANGAGPGSDSDDDDDVIMGNSKLSLKDIWSGQRIAHPARFSDTGLGPSAFDLDNFLDNAAQTRKWLDPHSMKTSTVQQLQADAYLSHILSCLVDLPDVVDIEIDPEGSWRPAGSSSAFMSLLDGSSTPAAAAAAAANAAANAGAAAAVTAANGRVKPEPGAQQQQQQPGWAGDGSDDDEEDEEEEMRRAAAEAAASRRTTVAKEPAVEVIDLLSDSDDEDMPAAPPPPAAAAAGARGGPRPPPLTVQGTGSAAAGGSTAGARGAATAGPARGGLVIHLPNRARQQQQQQQPYGTTHAAAARATAATAAAAVGPSVACNGGVGMQGGGAGGGSSSRGQAVHQHVQGIAAGAAAGTGAQLHAADSSGPFAAPGLQERSLSQRQGSVQQQNFLQQGSLPMQQQCSVPMQQQGLVQQQCSVPMQQGSVQQQSLMMQQQGLSGLTGPSSTGSLQLQGSAQLHFQQQPFQQGSLHVQQSGGSFTYPQQQQQQQGLLLQQQHNHQQQLGQHHLLAGPHQQQQQYQQQRLQVPAVGAARSGGGTFTSHLPLQQQQYQYQPPPQLPHAGHSGQYVQPQPPLQQQQPAYLQPQQSVAYQQHHQQPVAYQPPLADVRGMPVQQLVVQQQPQNDQRRQQQVAVDDDDDIIIDEDLLDELTGWD